MKNKLVAGFMAATMMVSVMSTGVFAKELNPDSETNKAGDTQVTATVEENENKAAYVIEIPDKVDFGKIQQPETEGNAYSTKDITVSCIQADNLAAGSGIAVLVKDATATQSTDPFCLTHNTHSDCVLNYEINRAGRICDNRRACAAYGSALQYFEILYRGRNAAVRAGRRESDQKIPQS